MSLRLDAFLSRCGYGSRSEVKHLIRRGAVTVDGQRATGAKQPITDQTIQVAGETVIQPPTEAHLMLHKPVGYACSHDCDESPLIYDLLPEPWNRTAVESAGRLDRATSGLLVLSTDGGFVHQLIHPKRHLPKRYRVCYAGTLVRDAIRRCAEGLHLLDDQRPCRPAELAIETADDEDRGRATITLFEGRYHQVRRMFLALGAEVVGLHRDRIGHLDLPHDLAPGQVRPLTDQERTTVLQV